MLIASYDPETDLWSVIPALPYGVYAHSACTLNGTIYITGGVTDNLSDPVPVSMISAVNYGKLSAHVLHKNISIPGPLTV